MLASLALLAMLDILTAFLPLVGERAGVSPAWIGVLLAVRGGASIVSRVLLPWLAHRMSRRALLLVSLASLGVKAGDRIAIISENRPEWSIVDYAVLFIGATLFGGLTYALKTIHNFVGPLFIAAALWRLARTASCPPPGK